MTTEAQQEALEKPVVRVAYFVEFDFKGGTARLSTLNQNLDWGGYTWAGVGAITDISQVNESVSIESSPLNFSINGATTDMISLAVGSVEEYRVRPVKMWMCPLDESYQLIDEPELCWTGTMDTVVTSIDGEDGGIILKAENSVYGLKRKQSLRMNAAQQKKRYPTDTGFDYLTGLIAQKQMWLSIKFQSI